MSLQLIMDSLRYWAIEMHVDGFRFDLAAALAREFHDVDRLAEFMAEYGDHVAAVFVEPVQGTGTVPLQAEFVRALLSSGAGGGAFCSVAGRDGA